MNGQLDWFYWVPYIEMSLLAADRDNTDINLAKGWQIGIVADGLVRGRLEIPEFEATTPDLKQVVSQTYSGLANQALIDGMQARATRYMAG